MAFFIYAQTGDNDSDSDGISNGLSFGEGGGANAGNSNTQTTTISSTTRTTTRTPFSFTRPTPASSNPGLPGLGIGDAMNAIGRIQANGKLERFILIVLSCYY